MKGKKLTRRTRDGRNKTEHRVRFCEICWSECPSRKINERLLHKRLSFCFCSHQVRPQDVTHTCDDNSFFAAKFGVRGSSLHTDDDRRTIAAADVIYNIQLLQDAALSKHTAQMVIKFSDYASRQASSRLISCIYASANFSCAIRIDLGHFWCRWFGIS